MTVCTSEVVKDVRELFGTLVVKLCVVVALGLVELVELLVDDEVSAVVDVVVSIALLLSPTGLVVTLVGEEPELEAAELEVTMVVLVDGGSIVVLEIMLDEVDDMDIQSVHEDGHP